MTFGQKLKQARKDANLSQEQLADKLLVSRSAIAKWESDLGMPEVGNLKMMAQALDVTVDYLLDDGTSLDLNVIKKPIDLASYIDKKITVFNKKEIKDRIVRENYQEAEIFTLLADEKLNKNEKIVDFLVWLLTPLMDVVKFSKQLNNLENDFYLVNEANKQYFVLVNDDYIESRELASPITQDKFELGNYKFVKCKKSNKI